MTSLAHASMAPRRGFTLVELLVVIAIIGVLSGLLIPMIRVARIKSKVTVSSQDIAQLKLGLESYNSDWGDYPPTSLEDNEDYGYTGNGINDGIESLIAHLQTQKMGGPYFDFREDQLRNQDSDRVDQAVVDQLNWVFGDNQLREYVDAFGTAYVYIHNRDYDRSYQITQGDETTASARASRSAQTANFHGLSTFQIWSLGEDGKNQNGLGQGDEPLPGKEKTTGDDIGSW